MSGLNRDEKIGKSDPSARRASREIPGYLLSVLSVSVATGVTLLLGDYTFRTPFFFVAILVSTWFGGRGPRLFAVWLSTLSITFFILEPRFSCLFGFGDVLHLAVFLFCALVISSWSTARRRAEHALERARDGLEKKVQERTAELSSSNEQLRLQITERKEAEENLRHSEAFLTEGQRISHTGSWSWDVSTGKVAWSAEHFRIFGVDPEKTEPSLQLFLETVHPEDRSFIERSLKEAVRDRSGFDLEFRIELADGSIKHVQGVGRPTLAPSGDVDRYNGTTVDIS